MSPNPHESDSSGGNKSDDLRRVELIWIEKKIEHRIRFGRAVEEKIIDSRRRVLAFAPNSIFALLRWVSSDFGTVISRIDIVRTVRRGEVRQTLPFVRPGGESLLRISSWPKVERALQAIDAVEALGVDPTDAAPDYWRHVHNRIAAGHEPRLHTIEHIAPGCCA
jgi:hypothetical protein